MRIRHLKERNSSGSPVHIFSSKRLVVSYTMMLASALGVVICYAYHASIASATFAFLAVIALAVADLRAVLVLAYPILTLSGVILSLSVIEQGAYITEEQRYGKNIGATPMFGLYTIAFLLLAYAALSLLLRFVTKTRQTVRATPLILIIAGISIASGLFYGVVFMTSGSGLSHDARFDWLQTLPPLIVKVHQFFGSFAIPVAFTAAGAFWRIFGLRSYRLWLVTLVIPILAIVGTGEKYSAFSVMICMTLVGIGVGSYVLNEPIYLRLRWRYVIAALALGAVLSIVVIAGYLRMGTSGGGLWAALSTRLALQGHVWFGIFDHFGGRPGVSLFDLVRPNEHDSPGGLDFLSYFVAERNYVYQRIGRGISFTMGGPPSALAAFGAWPGLIVYGLLGTFYAIAIFAMVQCLRHRMEIMLAIGVVFYVIVGATTQMGRWDTAYGTVAIVVYISTALGAAFVVARQRTRPHRENTAPNEEAG